MLVSTHSRPKAAASACNLILYNIICFNTQPPEGGCLYPPVSYNINGVSTHSRPKAAAVMVTQDNNYNLVSTHSRPKAAAVSYLNHINLFQVSTHSRPKAAANIHKQCAPCNDWFQHTAARRRLRTFMCGFYWSKKCFNTQPPEGGCHIKSAVRFCYNVSTHSRPKAAAHATFKINVE